MKILFAIPRLKSMYGDYEGSTGHPHVGVAYLSSWLKSKDIQVELFDDGIEFSHSKLLNKVKETKPDLIGVTMFSYCYSSGYDMIQFLKKNTEIPLVVGGPHVSSTRKQILKETDADFAVKHEGEHTLVELIKEVVKKKPDYFKIDGLIYKDSKNIIIENKDKAFLTSEELDNLPLPDYESFGLKKYKCYHLRTLPLLTSRGCPYGCNYCSVKLSLGRNFRYRTAQNVFDEIKHWCDKGWNHFEINDDCFTTHMIRAAEICDLIIEKGLKIHFSLYNGIRVDSITYDLLKKMKEAGCTFVTFGCESGNDEILKIINKGITKEQVMTASKWCNELGIKHSINFIIGHTSETYEMAMDSIRFAQELPCDFVNFYNLVPYPGTEAYIWARKNGTFLVPEEDYLKYVSYRDNTPIFETPEFSEKERKEVTKMGFDLYEKKTLQFRLGQGLGTLAYHATRIPFVHRISLMMFQSNIGSKIYNLLSWKSRE